MSNNLKSLLAQVNSACNELQASIRSLDSQIEELESKRRNIGEAGVSKADFLGYIDKTIESNSGRIGGNVAHWLNKVERSFFNLERSTLYIPFLTGNNGIPTVITEEAAYWYLKPAIMARMAELAEGMDFPADAVSVDERRKMIAEIDAEIARLNGERDELNSQMVAAGINS